MTKKKTDILPKKNMNCCLFLGYLVEGGQKESSGCNRHRKDLGLRKSVVLFLSSVGGESSD